MSQFSLKIGNISINSLEEFDDLDINDLDKQIDIIVEREFKSSNFNFDLSKISTTYRKTNGGKFKSTPPLVTTEKSKLKQSLKQEVKKKFKRNDFICLRTKAKDGSRKIDRVYQIKQIVWSMGEIVLKALVVKQISGPNYNMFSLNRYDCERVHVKYEPGLQLLSMELPWINAKSSMIPDEYKPMKTIKK